MSVPRGFCCCAATAAAWRLHKHLQFIYSLLTLLYFEHTHASAGLSCFLYLAANCLPVSLTLAHTSTAHTRERERDGDGERLLARPKVLQFTILHSMTFALLVSMRFAYSNSQMFFVLICHRTGTNTRALIDFCRRRIGCTVRFFRSEDAISVRSATCVQFGDKQQSDHGCQGKNRT